MRLGKAVIDFFSSSSRKLTAQCLTERQSLFSVSVLHVWFPWVQENAQGADGCKKNPTGDSSVAG